MLHIHSRKATVTPILLNMQSDIRFLPHFVKYAQSHLRSDCCEVTVAKRLFPNFVKYAEPQSRSDCTPRRRGVAASYYYVCRNYNINCVTLEFMKLFRNQVSNDFIINKVVNSSNIRERLSVKLSLEVYFCYELILLISQ